MQVLIALECPFNRGLADQPRQIVRPHLHLYSNGGFIVNYSKSAYIFDVLRPLKQHGSASSAKIPRLAPPSLFFAARNKP